MSIGMICGEKLMLDNPYAEVRRTREKPVRLVVFLKREQVDEVDKWAVGKQQPNRTAALRALIDAGLKAVTSDEG